jgi:hypothetical protein
MGIPIIVRRLSELGQVPRVAAALDELDAIVVLDVCGDPPASTCRYESEHLVFGLTPITERAGGRTASWAKPAARGGFASSAEVQIACEQWIEAFLPDMQERRSRRGMSSLLARPERLDALRVWEHLDELEQRRIARLLSRTPRAISNALMSEAAYCALDHGRALLLAAELAAVRGHAPSSGRQLLTSSQRTALLGALSPRARRAYEQVRDIRSWTPLIADVALIRGADHCLHEQAALVGAARQRSALDNRNGWFHLTRDLPCGVPPS